MPVDARLKIISAERFTAEERTGVLLPIASGQDLPGSIKVHQDVAFYVSHLREGDRVLHELKPGRRAFLYLIEGELTLNGETLSTGDQARITAVKDLEFTGIKASEIILIDLP